MSKLAENESLKYNIKLRNSYDEFKQSNYFIYCFEQE